MFDEYFNPSNTCVSPVSKSCCSQADVLADHPSQLPSINKLPSQVFPTSQRTCNSLPIISQGFVILILRTVSTEEDNLIPDVMWCYFDAFLTSVEPKNFKQAMTKPSWIDAMQEEIHEFERLEV
ncbi:hypothetical protein Tco_1045351 [Tanacetum coccineum]|uniref:Integrase, catalytic region, zinc finger, CCHC-type, peptidase aspartic, catalytic n=1 Tax=Tanacetum coccineum TaxID=301880 RepID=A0ABQ5GTR3_9ASTR